MKERFTAVVAAAVAAAAVALRVHPFVLLLRVISNIVLKGQRHRKNSLEMIMV